VIGCRMMIIVPKFYFILCLSKVVSLNSGIQEHVTTNKNCQVMVEATHSINTEDLTRAKSVYCNLCIN
jgi:hypothetical protein